MGKTSFKKRRSTIRQGLKGWKQSSRDGLKLIWLLRKGKVSPGITPTALKEEYPQYRKYKPDALASGLRRIKLKYGFNVRGGGTVRSESDSDDESDDGDNQSDDDESKQDLTLKTEEDEELDADDSVKDQLMGDAESEPKKPEAKVAPPASRVVSLPASVAASAGALYRTPPVFRPPRPFMPSVGSDGEYYPDHIGNWKPWFVKPFWTDTNMNTHQSFLISLPSGVGYEDSGDVTPTLVQQGVATYLSIHINLPEWIAREHFLPFLKTTRWDNVKQLVVGMSDDQRQAFKSNANDNFVLLAHALRGELAAKVKGRNDDYPELDDECKLRVDMEVQPLRDEDWDIVGNKADGIRYLFVDLKAAVNELSKDKSKIKRSKLQGVAGK